MPLTAAAHRVIINRVIKAAAEYEIDLDTNDFVIIDGYPTLDGMDPDEWLDAMTMD